MREEGGGGGGRGQVEWRDAEVRHGLGGEGAERVVIGMRVWRWRGDVPARAARLRSSSTSASDSVRR